MGWGNDPAVQSGWGKDPVVGEEDMPELPTGEPTAEGWARPSSTLTKIARRTKRAATNIGKDALAVGELGVTGATAGAGAISGGALAAFGMMFNQSPDAAAETIRYVADAFTIEPISERGQKLLQDVAVPMIKLDEEVDDFAWKLSFGNQYAATAIKTAIMGPMETAFPVRNAAQMARANRAIAQKAKDIQATADRLNVTLDHENLKSSIVDAARQMAPTEKAQNVELLKEALLEAENISRNKKKEAYARAKATRTYIDTGAVADLSKDIRSQLMERGFDVQDMPLVNKRLSDLLGDEQSPLVNVKARLGELEKVRKRVIRNRSANPSENAALNHIKKEIDTFIDNEFNNLAMGNGSAISGDPAGVIAWKEAREANTVWSKNFREDKVVAQLIAKNSTPEQYRQWLVGASAMGAKKEAASVIARMRNVLGDDHPAIEGIRQDFLFEIAEPLLKDVPNFGQFTRNYDLFIKRNPSLVKELGLKQSDLQHLYDFAVVQQKLPRAIQVGRRDVTKALSQFIFGHKIAEGSLRVNMSRNVMNFIFGIDRISQKQILAEIVGAKYGEVAMPKGSLIAGQFIAGAAISELQNVQRDPLLVTEEE